MCRYRFVALAILALLSGCGRVGPQKVSVSGTVHLDGKPLRQGEIYFMAPSSGKPPEVLPVTEGKFEGQLTLGSKRVEVHSSRQVDPEPGTTLMGPPPTINLVHDDYNVNSKLTAEVTDDGLAPSRFEVKGTRSAP